MKKTKKCLFVNFVICHTFWVAEHFELLMTKPVMSEQYFRYWPDRNSVVNVKLGGLPFGTDYTMTESMSSRLLTEFRDMHVGVAEWSEHLVHGPLEDSCT